MANLDPKTTQTISKFSADDVAVITEKKLYAVVESDKEIQVANQKLAELEEDQVFSNNEQKTSLENTVQSEQQKIIDTLYVLKTIGSFSVEFNSIVLKGMYTTLKNEEELSSSCQDSLKDTIAELLKAREELNGETYDFDVATEDAEVESKEEEPETSEEEAKVSELEELKEENEKLKTKTISLQTRIRELEDKAKLFMYCGLGVACITLLSLVFSIIAMAK